MFHGADLGLQLFLGFAEGHPDLGELLLDDGLVGSDGGGGGDGGGHLGGLRVPGLALYNQGNRGGAAFKT